MLSSGNSHRKFRTPTAHTGRPYRCCAVTPHVAENGMHYGYGKAEPDVPEALQETETMTMGYCCQH